jgi:CBS domain-containing protein
MIARPGGPWIATYSGMAHTQHAPGIAPQLLAADQTPIATIMTRSPIVVHAELGLEELVETFLDQNISRAPVVDQQGKLIGIVSKSDLIVDQYARGDTQVDQRGADEPGSHVHELGGIVGDVMTRIAFALPESTSIGAAARRMLADNVHAMPVTSSDGRVVGILSATDVVAWVAGAAPTPA